MAGWFLKKEGIQKIIIAGAGFFFITNEYIWRLQGHGKSQITWEYAELFFAFFFKISFSYFQEVCVHSIGK